VCDQTRIEIAGFPRLLRILRVELAEAPRRGPRLPMRQLQARDPPALLVDEHRRVRVADALAQGAGQRADLIGIGDVARKQDETPRLDGAEESALVLAERGSGAAIDRARAHQSSFNARE